MGLSLCPTCRKNQREENELYPLKEVEESENTIYAIYWCNTCCAPFKMEARCEPVNLSDDDIAELIHGRSVELPKALHPPDHPVM